MGNQPATCVAISDFHIENFTGLLTGDPGRPVVRAVSVPFGQVMQVLMDGRQACWAGRPDAAVIWTQPHGVIESFRRLRDGEPVALEMVLEEVDAFASAVIRASGRVTHLFIPTWVVPPYSSEPGLLEMRHTGGTTNILMRMNLRLAERLDQAPNIHVLNAQKWIEAAGTRAFSPKLWYMAKVAFGQEVFQAAVLEIKAAMYGLTGQAKKLIIFDLDETLWGGVVGETGWEQLTLGGHDQAGEAFVDFQKALKALSRRGVLLGIVSKNDEAVALEAIRNRPEMVLTTDDLAGWRINWDDKAKNVAELVSELNLGLHSVVFIDNHPVERARVHAVFRRAARLAA